MKLNSTSECKNFIEALINKSPFLQTELAAHEIFNWTPKKWSRVSKQTVRSDDEYDWVLESNSGHNFGDTWLKSGQTTLVNCVCRQFLHKDGDCMIGIFTEKDGSLVAWGFSID